MVWKSWKCCFEPRSAVDVHQARSEHTHCLGILFQSNYLLFWGYAVVDGLSVLPAAWFPPRLCNSAADPLVGQTSGCATFWRIPLASWATHTWWHPGVRALCPDPLRAGGCCGTCTARPSRQLWSAKKKKQAKLVGNPALLFLKCSLKIQIKQQIWHQATVFTETKGYWFHYILFC